MGKRIASDVTRTPTATADATNLVDAATAAGYPVAFQGGSATQRYSIVEVYLGGQAGASSPSIMLLSFDSQAATGSLTKDTNLTDSISDANAVALSTAVAVFNKAATNKPQRSATQHLANLSFNAFGGIVRLNWPQDQQFVGVGATTANASEISLSAFTGGTTGLMGCHVIYEPF